MRRRVVDLVGGTVFVLVIAGLMLAAPTDDNLMHAVAYVLLVELPGVVLLGLLALGYVNWRTRP